MIRQVLRRAIRGLTESQRYFLLREVANSMGISDVAANGPIGPMEGNLNDWTIFRRYVRGEPWEPETVDICADYFTKNGAGTFVDVGANIGMIFVPVVRRARVYGIAIDASPVNYPCLAANCVRHLDADSYRLSHVAVGAAKGRVRFNTSDTNFGNHRVDGAGNIEVDVVAFDDLHDASSMKTPIFVKLDIQGFELEFLRGASTLIERCDALLLEYSPFSNDDAGWICELDNYLLKHFAFFISGQDIKRGILPPKEQFRTLDRDALASVKTHIASRRWPNPREGHENIMLFKHSVETDVIMVREERMEKRPKPDVSAELDLAGRGGRGNLGQYTRHVESSTGSAGCDHYSTS